MTTKALPKIPISVFIITKNEADRISDAINAVIPIADEIIVIDSGSTDDTVKICSDLGANVIFNKWIGYGQQKIFGENKCKNNWVLNIDADEVLSNDLVLEIKKVFDGEVGDDIGGFRVKIINKFPSQKYVSKFAYYFNQLRIYNKNFGGFKDSTVHDSVEMRDKSKFIKQLNGGVYHSSFRSFSHWIDKINSYSSMQASEFLEKRAYKLSFFKRIILNLKILITPIFSFFKAYIVRRYFIYGIDGISYSYMYALSRIMKVIKIREGLK